jgi:hypothetical protein
VGKGGPDVSIDPQHQIRRAHQQRRGGHGGTRAVPYGHASAAFAHPTMPLLVRASILRSLQNLILFPQVGRAQSVEGVRKLVTRKYSDADLNATDKAIRCCGGT